MRLTNLKITGSSQATGGSYDTVKIVGEGTIDGDVECNRLKCVGTMQMQGQLKAKDVRVVGTSSWSDRVQADTMSVSGTAAIGGDAAIRELRCSGTVEANGNLASERVQLKGELSIRGDCEAERFEGRGMFRIGGLLNAGELDIKLYRPCKVREIGGGRISVRKASLLNPLSLFFRPSSDAELSVSIVEGDEIYLEHTKAKVVRGNRIVIGPGCEIELAEYKERFERRGDSLVRDNRQI
jgi:cytoskeletal protein CcmA (bactofilin family)